MMATTTAEHHVRPDALLFACSTCTSLTLWRCMSCLQPTCHPCSYSQFAMCQPCRAFYHGPVYELGARADKFIHAEWLRVFSS